MKNFSNIVAFQGVWFASVLGAAHGYPWIGAVALLPFLLWQLGSSSDPGYDLRALLVMGAAGLAIDSIYPILGSLSYSSPWPSSGFAPAWLVVMWLNLALTMNHSLRWLRRRYLLAALFGSTGGALSYWAGARLGAMQLHWPTSTIIPLIGLIWAVALPATYRALERPERT
ncbi:MAG: DUF2878 domain-containing protein [Gammaproteobacteria bacterium]|nr:MAG: DUF2878 domain-containing protein [Gammaproteobacteria bacterium]